MHDQDFESYEKNSRERQLMNLWMLRILMLLEGYLEFFDFGGFGKESIAESLGLYDKNSECWDDVKRKDGLHRLWDTYRKANANFNKNGIPTSVLSSNIERLGQQLSLSEIEMQLLEFVVMVHNEPQLVETLETIDGRGSLRLTYVLSTILDVSIKDIEEVLSPNAKLISTGLVVVERSRRYRISHALSVFSEDFARHISTAEAEPEELLKSSIRRARATRLRLSDYQHIQPMLDVLVPYLDQVKKIGRKGVNIFVYGQPGTGKTELARVLADTLNLDLYEVTTDEPSGRPANSIQRLSAYRVGQGIFSGQKALMVFDEAEDVFNETVSFFQKSTAHQHKGWMNHLLENNAVPTVWLSNEGGLDPAFIRRFDMVFELPVPPRSQRRRILQEYGGGMLDESTMARFAEAEALSPAVIERTCAVLSTLEQTTEARNASFAYMVNATLKAQGHKEAPAVSGLLPAIYDTAFVNTKIPLDALAQGIADTQSARLCFYGPSGTGKTSYAHWLSNVLDKPLLVKRASDLLGKYVGETEKNIAQAFSQAQQENAVLLIDEVDSFLQERLLAKQHWQVSIVNEMLTCMESFEGVFIASTNLMGDIDAAALRRFDLKLEFGYLTALQTQQLFQRYCQELGLAGDTKAGARVKSLQHLTPGDFAAVARQHKFRPLATAWQLVEALTEEVACKGGNKHPFGFV